MYIIHSVTQRDLQEFVTGVLKLCHFSRRLGPQENAPNIWDNIRYPASNEFLHTPLTLETTNGRPEGM